MLPLTRNEFDSLLEEGRKTGSLLEVCLEGEDLSGMDFSGLDCSHWQLKNVCLDGCSFKNGSIAHGRFENCSFKNADFTNASLEAADLRCADLTNANISGANLFCAWLEGAVLTGVKDDENTRFYRLHCPEKGAFIAYKKCYENRIVMLLVPADAKRVSATNKCCRCNKAKVLTITSFDFSERYTWANSLVDENFIYRVGEYVYPDRFTEDRWCDSTYGIHFWMTREDAMAY